MTFEEECKQEKIKQPIPAPPKTSYHPKCLICGSSAVKREPGAKVGNINEYRPVILSGCPKFEERFVKVNWLYMLKRPWESWGKTPAENPSWWTSYNKVKHERNNYFRDANLENAINAVAGLYVMVDYYHGGNFSVRPADLMTFPD